MEWLEVVVQFPKSQIILADRYSTNNLKKAEYAQVFEGENYLDCLQNNHVELVFKAPGIWSLLPELEDFRKRKGLNRVMSSLVFFVERFREQIIGVTGTKGKSTVSSLTNHLLNELGKDRIKSYYCGNTTNISPYQHWTKLDQSVESKTFFVIELSSFQLQDLGYAKISPKYSIITNYYTDHQDQHASIEEYWAAKNNIFLYQNVGDVFVTTQELINKINAQSFDQKLIQLSDEDIQQKIADFDFVLPGEHNQTNLALSLSMINEILETPLNNVQNSLNSYSPLPYRNQLIRTEIVVIRVNKLEKNLKINWVNDGAASEPDAVAAAVRTFGEDDYLWVQFTGKIKEENMKKLLRRY
ncbi:MAG: hypothetical protein HC932_00895 [Thermales bacterium]|nr:hypothetical protein [Thermales bacterium]